MDRRGFLTTLVAIGVATATPNIVDKGLEVIARAGAEESPVYDDIGKYYDDGTPSDVMPGTRKCQKAEINDKALAFNGTSWFESYFDNPNYSYTLQNMFRELDGKEIVINSPGHEGETIVFDFNKFHDFNSSFRKKANCVGLWYDGFMSFQDNKTYEDMVIPVPPYIVDLIKKL